jgi:hypothetical protein
MNTPSQTTANGTAQTVISAARCALLYCTVQNTSGSPRMYKLHDTSSAPATDGRALTSSGITSPIIAAGATWTVFSVDAAHGTPFTSGVVFQSFAVDANRNPVMTALSAADANVVAWSATLQ